MRSAAVLFVKNETTDILCWIAWYFVQGFDVLIIFDDYSSDGTWEKLTRASNTRKIHLFRACGSRALSYQERQCMSYRWVLVEFAEEFDWIGFFDADEYLLLSPTTPLQTFLAQFDDADGIAINWCNYGSGGHVLKPKITPIEAYTWHGTNLHNVNRHVKSLVRPKKVGFSWKNVHCFDVPFDRYFDSNHDRVEWSDTLGITARAPDWRVAKIMHFQCRSMEHFIERMRKRPELADRPNLWNIYNMNEVEDRTALLFVDQVTSCMSELEDPASPSSCTTEIMPLRPASQASLSAANDRRNIIQRLWRGQDPFSGFPKHLYEADTQGWGSTHTFLTDAIETVRPKIVVEIGVWKGGSAITMASRLRDMGLDGVILAVDTWLGSWDHWLSDDWFQELGWLNGYPSINRKFMMNVVTSGLQNYVVPLPLDSLNAAQVLGTLEIFPDVIHIDGAHDFDSVTSDLRAWWPLLRPGGILIGDDYYEDTHWPGVKLAFNTFFPQRKIEHAGGKCRLYKTTDGNY